MTFDETVAVLRPYMHPDGGALGSLGVATFFLKDGVITLEFTSGEAGRPERRRLERNLRRSPFAPHRGR